MSEIHKSIPTINSKNTHTDIRLHSIIYRVTPLAWHDYINLMRLDRPVGIYLLFLPALWGILGGGVWMNASITTTVSMVILFGLGSVLMRGAGCVINDLWDRDFDRHVERTKNRAIAAGRISVRAAFLFLFLLLALSLLILIQLPKTAIFIGILSLIPVILYPLAKRVTWYPQLVLGITFNMGVLMGAAALLDDLPFAFLCLYAAACFWTLGYDTVYAHQDIEDDVQIGIKSTAIRFQHHAFEFVGACYVMMAVLMAISLYNFQNLSWGWGFYVLGHLYILFHHYQWQPANAADSLHRFKSHVFAGWILAGSFLPALFM